MVTWVGNLVILKTIYISKGSVKFCVFLKKRTERKKGWKTQTLGELFWLSQSLKVKSERLFQKDVTYKYQYFNIYRLRRTKPISKQGIHLSKKVQSNLCTVTILATPGGSWSEVALCKKLQVVPQNGGCCRQLVVIRFDCIYR